MKTVFIGNILEEALPLTALMNEPEKAHEITEDLALNERFLFCAPFDHKILVTPLPINAEFLEDSLKILGSRNVTTLHPKIPSESICKDLATNTVLKKQFLHLLSHNNTTNLTAYVASREFFELRRWLNKHHIPITIQDAPDPAYAWTAPYFDSKSGFAQISKEVRKINGIGVLDRFIASNKEETIKIAQFLLSTYGGVVLKTNRGLAGMGLRQFTLSEIKQPQLTQEIDRLWRQDPYWSKEPVILEQLISASTALCGGQPNIELRIDKRGVIEALYCCGMRITKSGIFRGIEIGRGVVPKTIEQQLVAYGKQFGKRIKRYGYRGYYDVDMVYGQDKTMYPLESNLRRTGGTHVFETAQHLLGQGFLKRNYILSDNLFPLTKTSVNTYKQLKAKAQAYLYPIEHTKRGVVITMVSMLKEGTLGYMVIGRDKGDAYEIEHKFLGLLK